MCAGCWDSLKRILLIDGKCFRESLDCFMLGARRVRARGRDVWRVVWRKCLMCLGSRHVATCPAVEQWLKCDTSVINGHEDRLGINQPITGPYKVRGLARATDVRCCDVTRLCFINTLLHVYNQPKKLTFTSQVTHWWHIFGKLKSASKIFIVS